MGRPHDYIFASVTETDRQTDRDRDRERERERERRSCSDTHYIIIYNAGSCTLYKQINRKDDTLYRLYKRIFD